MTAKKERLAVYKAPPFPEEAAAAKADPCHNVFFITRKAWKEIIRHCENERPCEACGLLSGKNGLAYKVWKMKNIHHSPTSFAMDHDELRYVFAEMDKYNQQFMGIYHSHPSGIAYPSREDILYNQYPDIIHLIVSLAGQKPVLKAYRYHGTAVIPYKINVTDV